MIYSSCPIGRKEVSMEVIAVGGIGHTGDNGSFAPSSYPAIVKAVARDVAVGLTVRMTEDFKLAVGDLSVRYATIEMLQTRGMVAVRTGDTLLPPPFHFVLEKLIGGVGAHHVPIFLEMPELGAATEMVQLCRSLERTHQDLENQVQLSSDRIEVLHEWLIRFPNVARVWRTSIKEMQSDYIQRVVTNLALSGITLVPDEISSPLVRWMNQHEVVVRLRNIDDPERLRQFGDWGVAGVFTHRPSAVLEYVQGWNTPTLFIDRRKKSKLQ